MTRIALALVAPMLLAAAAPAPASGEIGWLVGDWSGSGTIFGAPSTAELHVKPALGGRFTELRYRVDGKRQGTAFRFEGAAFYERAADANGGWTARWFDSSGAKHPITATAADNALTALWGEAATERGRTVYRRQPDGSLEVVDEVADKSGWRVFARHVLKPAR